MSILKLGTIKEAHHTQKKRENQMEGPPLPARPLARQENQLIPPQTLHFFH